MRGKYDARAAGIGVLTAPLLGVAAWTLLHGVHDIQQQKEGNLNRVKSTIVTQGRTQKKTIEPWNQMPEVSLW